MRTYKYIITKIIIIMIMIILHHRTGKGVSHPVRPKNFKANILCQKHNTALFPADSTAPVGW